MSIDFLIVLVSEWIEKHHKTYSEQALSDNEKSRVHTHAKYMTCYLTHEVLVGLIIRTGPVYSCIKTIQLKIVSDIHFGFSLARSLLAIM